MRIAKTLDGADVNSADVNRLLAHIISVILSVLSYGGYCTGSVQNTGLKTKK